MLKKKILSMFLVGALCSSLLVGCGGKETPETSVEKEEVNSSSEVITNDFEENKETSKNDATLIDDFFIDVAPEEFTSNQEPVFELEEQEKLEIEEFVDPTVPTNEKEYLDFTSFEEVDMVDGLYEDIDVSTLMPTNNMEVSIDSGELMKLVIGVVDKNMELVISNDVLTAKMYMIDDTIYSYCKEGEEEMYSFSKVSPEEDEETLDTDELTSGLGTTDYSTANIKEIKYVKAVASKDGRVFDVIEALIDPREEGQEDMLAYETPNGIMYLSEGMTMTLNGVTYGGEDGVQPLDEVPMNVHHFYIERESSKLKGIVYEANGVPAVARVNEISEIILPEGFENAVESTEDEIVMTVAFAVMAIAFSGLEGME